jgi:hypothetical protein
VKNRFVNTSSENARCVNPTQIGWINATTLHLKIGAACQTSCPGKLRFGWYLQAKRLFIAGFIDGQK